MQASPAVVNALPRRFRLGAWVVDSALGELVGDGERVPLNGLSLALLLALVKRAGQLADSDSLIAEVWERAAVSDATLQQRIKLLRRALRDDSETPRYIATVRGRGYRLLLQAQWLDEPLCAAPAIPAAIVEISASAAPAAPGTSWRRRGSLLTLALLILALLGAAGWYWYSQHAMAKLNPRRLVVLPLMLTSTGSQDESVADEISEQLIWSLSRVPGLEVIARSSSMSYKQRPRALAQFAAELAVGSVLRGSIQNQAQRWQISLELLDVSSQQVLWQRRFEGVKEELNQLQTQVSEQVALALGVPASLTAAAPIDGDADSLYLQGRQHYLRYRQQDNASAMALFRASLARSPAYAPALAGLSDTYAQAVYQFGAPNWQLDEALRYAEAAVALAPQLAEAHKARGLALDLLGRRQEAASSYHRASSLNPNYSDALINEAILHWEAGRLADAYQLARRATSLDPLDPYAYLITAQVLSSAGFAPAAQAILEQVHKHAPENAMAHTIRCAHWFELGQAARAEQECQALIQRHADFAPGWTLAADLALYNGQTELATQRFNRARALGAGDDAFYARLRLALMQTPVHSASLLPLIKQLSDKIQKHNEDPDQQLQLAMLLAGQGQLEQGMQALEAAVQAGHNDRHWLQTDPLLAALRRHPRYPGLLAKLDARLSAEHKKLQALLPGHGLPSRVQILN